MGSSPLPKRGSLPGRKLARPDRLERFTVIFGHCGSLVPSAKLGAASRSRSDEMGVTGDTVKCRDLVLAPMGAESPKIASWFLGLGWGLAVENRGRYR
jgi:hypothetical protein